MNRSVTIAALWISLVSPGHGEEIRVTLLGTGDPRPVMEHFGPAGTRQMLDHLTQAYSFDIAIRIADDGVAESGSQFEVVEVENGFEWSHGDISVRAFDVDHRPGDRW